MEKYSIGQLEKMTDDELIHILSQHSERLIDLRIETHEGSPIEHLEHEIDLEGTDIYMQINAFWATPIHNIELDSNEMEIRVAVTASDNTTVVTSIEEMEDFSCIASIIVYLQEIEGFESDGTPIMSLTYDYNQAQKEFNKVWDKLRRILKQIIKDNGGEISGAELKDESNNILLRITETTVYFDDFGGEESYGFNLLSVGDLDNLIDKNLN